MKIIDLTFPIYDGMPVYPGDEGLVVEQASTVQDDEWGMKRLHINLHDGTHLNMPAHTVVEGKTLDDFPVQAFMGPCVLNRLKEGRGSIFTQQLTQELYDEILQLRPLFVGFDHCLEQEELPYER